MKKNILFMLFVVSFFNNTHSQNIKTFLGKAFTSKDSSDYFFKIAKRNIKTPADEAEYYFCKNARCNDYGMLDSSIVYGEIALEKFKPVNNFNSMCYVYHNMSKTYNKQGNYDKTIKVLFSGLNLAEKANIEDWVNYFTTSLSLNYHDFESYEKGVFYGLKAVELARKAKKDSNGKMKFALNTLAINYDDWNKPEKALYYHYKNVKLTKGKDTLFLASTYNNIGNTLLKQKKFSEAQKWFNRSLVITNINFKSKPKDAYYFYEYSTIYTNLAAIAYQLDDFEKAEKLFEKAEFFSKNSKDAEKLRDYYQHFYLFNKKRGNLEKTIDSQEKYLVLRDSVFKTERAETFAELEAKYQNEKKEKEFINTKSLILQKDLEAKQKNNQLLIASILALGFLVIGFLFYRQQKLKNKQQEQEFKLKSAITKIETQNKLQEQRLSISRDLHDNIGAQLTFIISSVDSVKYGFEINNEKLDAKLTNISSFAKETIVELRDTIWAMNSNEISFEDLECRIHNFIEKAKEVKQEINFLVEIDKNLATKKLSSVEGMNVYRTIQEAINNSLKYANAKHVKIEALKEGNQTKVTVSDDGIGFNEAEINYGNGLNNMKKRIEEIGGTFNLNSTTNGTRIEILL